MKNKIYLSTLIAISLLGLVALPVIAQTGDYSVHLRRNFGYGGGTNIRGTFTISLIGEETQVDSVVFLIDEEPMATINTAPFRFKFETDDYGFGTHRLWAEVLLKDGTSQLTPVLQYNFVSPGEAREQMVTVLVGIGGAIIVAMALVSFIQSLMMKGKKPSAVEPGTLRSYGIFGGTICPRCGRPFPRHLWGMNLVVGRLDRCNHCGKWVMTVRASQGALRAAEQMESEPMGIEDELLEKSGPNRDVLEETKYIEEI